MACCNASLGPRLCCEQSCFLVRRTQVSAIPAWNASSSPSYVQQENQPSKNNSSSATRPARSTSSASHGSPSSTPTLSRPCELYSRSSSTRRRCTCQMNPLPPPTSSMNWRRYASACFRYWRLRRHLHPNLAEGCP